MELPQVSFPLVGITETAASVEAPAVEPIVLPPRYFRFWGNYVQEFLLDPDIAQRVVEYQVGTGDTVYGYGGGDASSSDWGVPVYNDTDDRVYVTTYKSTDGGTTTTYVLIKFNPRTMSIEAEVPVDYPNLSLDPIGDLVWTFEVQEARQTADMSVIVYQDPAHPLNVLPLQPVNGSSAAAPDRRSVIIDYTDDIDAPKIRIATITGLTTYTLSAPIEIPTGYGLGTAQTTSYIRGYGSKSDTYFNYGGDAPTAQKAGIIIHLTSMTITPVTNELGETRGLATFRSRYDEATDSYTMFGSYDSGDYDVDWMNGPIAVDAKTGIVIGKYGQGRVVSLVGGGFDYENSFFDEAEALGDGRLVSNNGAGTALGIWNILEPQVEPAQRLTSTTMSSLNVGDWFLGSTYPSNDYHVVVKSRIVS